MADQDEYTLVPIGVSNENSRNLKAKLSEFILGFSQNEAKEIEFILFNRLNPRKKVYKSIEDELLYGSFHQININPSIDSIYYFLESYFQDKNGSRSICTCPTFGDTWWEDLFNSLGNLVGTFYTSVGNFFSAIFLQSTSGYLNVYIYSGSQAGQSNPNWSSYSDYVSNLGVGTDYYGGGSGSHSVLVADNYGRKIYDNGLQATFKMAPFLENATVKQWKTLSSYSDKAQMCEIFLRNRSYSLDAIAIVEKYIYLFDKYPHFRNEYVSLSALNKDQFEAAAVIYEGYMQEIGEDPGDSYKWQLAMEVFREELFPILGGFTPVIGDFIDAYYEFNDGNYFMGCVSIVLSIVPSNEVLKVINRLDDIRTNWNRVKKIFVLWNKLFTLAGGQKVLNKMPQSWKNLTGSKLQPDLNSLKWVQPGGGHHFRLSDKKAIPQYENDKYPYGQFFKNGSFRDINGNPVPLQSGASHIRIDDLTDDFLNWFFN